jgi:hypothetical protein
MPLNVFVLGLDDFNLATMRRLPEERRYDFHPLLSYHEVRGASDYDYDVLLARAHAQLGAFDGTVDAIVTWWDFPSTALLPVLCERWDLRGPTLRSILVLENKYWSRVAQRAVARPYVPAFAAFDPFEDDALAFIERRGVTFPFWVKPVKSVASYLGFRIDDAEEFAKAVATLRDEIHLFGDPFQQALDRVELPADVDASGGTASIAEGLIGGRQCTLEGYVLDRTVTVYGVVDSLREPNGSTFHSYQYPSRLPLPIQERMIQIAGDVVTQAGLSESCFNIEFFYHEPTGHIWLLEVNTRLSQSHCELFAHVDGVSSQRVMLDVALGRRPRMPRGAGAYRVAGKFFLRHHQDGVVRAVPSASDAAEVERLHPDARVQLGVTAGTRLSDLPVQDSYSYQLGVVYLGGDSYDDLEARFRDVRSRLRFDIDSAVPA